MTDVMSRYENYDVVYKRHLDGQVRRGCKWRVECLVAFGKVAVDRETPSPHESRNTVEDRSPRLSKPIGNV